jgi:hypothetical protein
MPGGIMGPGCTVPWLSCAAQLVRHPAPLLRADDLCDPILSEAAQAVLAEVAERHATSLCAASTTSGNGDAVCFLFAACHEMG